MKGLYTPLPPAAAAAAANLPSAAVTGCPHKVPCHGRVRGRQAAATSILNNKLLLLLLLLLLLIVSLESVIITCTAAEITVTILAAVTFNNDLV
jgi:hypothetical protein